MQAPPSLAAIARDMGQLDAAITQLGHAHRKLRIAERHHAASAVENARTEIALAEAALRRLEHGRP